MVRFLLLVFYIILASREVWAGFPTYGNYCGPGHPKNEILMYCTEDEVPAVDQIDAICKIHDNCYVNTLLGIDRETGKKTDKTFCGCNQDMYLSLNKVLLPTSKYNDAKFVYNGVNDAPSICSPYMDNIGYVSLSNFFFQLPPKAINEVERKQKCDAAIEKIYKNGIPEIDFFPEDQNNKVFNVPGNQNRIFTDFGLDFNVWDISFDQDETQNANDLIEYDRMVIPVGKIGFGIVREQNAAPLIEVIYSAPLDNASDIFSRENQGVFFDTNVQDGIEHWHVEFNPSEFWRAFSSLAGSFYPTFLNLDDESDQLLVKIARSLSFSYDKKDMWGLAKIKGEVSYISNNIKQLNMGDKLVFHTEMKQYRLGAQAFSLTDERKNREQVSPHQNNKNNGIIVSVFHLDYERPTHHSSLNIRELPCWSAGTCSGIPIYDAKFKSTGIGVGVGLERTFIEKSNWFVSANYNLDFGLKSSIELKSTSQNLHPDEDSIHYLGINSNIELGHRFNLAGSDLDVSAYLGIDKKQWDTDWGDDFISDKDMVYSSGILIKWLW